MLWTGEKPESKPIEENMTSCSNTLQGFLLLSHGSRVGAGPTLSSSIHASVKQVADSSFRYMKALRTKEKSMRPINGWGEGSKDKMYQWILRQKQEGSRVTTNDILAHLQNELEYGAEESPMSPRQPFQQQNSQTAMHTNTGASIPSNAFATTVIGQGIRTGQPDQQAKNSVFSNALSSPIRRSLQLYHLAAQGSCPSSNIMPSGNGTRNSEMTYPSGQNRDTNSSNSSDCMDMYADSPGHDFSY